MRGPGLFSEDLAWAPASQSCVCRFRHQPGSCPAGTCIQAPGSQKAIEVRLRDSQGVVSGLQTAGTSEEETR